MIGAMLALLIGILASAAFSGLETGTYVLNRVRLDLRAAHGDRQALRIKRLLSRPQELLTALLIATNTANFAVTTVTVSLFAMAEIDSADLLTTLLVAPVLFVLGEVVPKNLFQRTGETLTYRLAWLASGATLICRWTGLAPLLTAFSRGLIWLWGGADRRAADPAGPGHRVRALLAEGHAHGVLTTFQSQMADRVVGLPNTTVAEVMVPLGNVAAIAADCSPERFRDAVADHNYSRLPIWRGKPGNVVGIVNIYDVLWDTDPATPPADHARAPITVDRGADVAAALFALRRSRRAMGIVIDDDGTCVGIITIKDLVEEIVGELGAW